jgi:hypothetical protein
MTFRSIALAATAGVIATVLLDVGVARDLSTDSRFVYNAVLRTSLLAMAAIAAGLAAHRFGWWREHLGRAWTLFFVEYALLTVSEVLRRGFPQLVLANEISLVVANLAAIGAYVLMARSLIAAGLASEESPAVKVAVTVLALVLAGALCYQSIASGWASLQSSSPRPGNVISPLADVITFVLVAPLLLTTFALRGGQVFWIFAFLTTGTVGWMVNQGAGAIVRFLGGGDPAVRTGRITGFAIACFFIAAAAITQRLAAQNTTRGAVAR